MIDLMGTGVTMTIGEMSPDQIFKDYARHIGIGGIATAGIIGIIKSFGVIKSAVGLAVGEFSKKGGNAGKAERTQEDIPMKTIVFGIVLTLLAVFAFFAFGGVVAAEFSEDTVDHGGGEYAAVFEDSADAFEAVG